MFFHQPATSFNPYLVQLVGKISSDIVSILNGLEHNLNGLEVKMKAFLQQEQQVQWHGARNFIKIEILYSGISKWNSSCFLISFFAFL